MHLAIASNLQLLYRLIHKIIFGMSNGRRMHFKSQPILIAVQWQYLIVLCLGLDETVSLSIRSGVLSGRGLVKEHLLCNGTVSTRARSRAHYINLQRSETPFQRPQGKTNENEKFVCTLSVYISLKCETFFFMMNKHKNKTKKKWAATRKTDNASTTEEWPNR